MRGAEEEHSEQAPRARGKGKQLRVMRYKAAAGAKAEEQINTNVLDYFRNWHAVV